MGEERKELGGRDHRSRSRARPPVDPTSRSLISALSSEHLSWTALPKPRPVLPRKAMRYGRRCSSKLVEPGEGASRGERRPFLASSRLGQSVGRRKEAPPLPQRHRSAGSLGRGSVGAVADCSQNSALSEAGLYCPRAFGSVAEGAIGKRFGGGAVSQFRHHLVAGLGLQPAPGDPGVSAQLGGLSALLGQSIGPLIARYATVGWHP